MSFRELVIEFNQLGCSDVRLCSIASRVYIDLQNVVKATHLEKLFDKDLNVVYILGKFKDENNLYLPLPSTSDIDFLIIEKIQTKFCSLEMRIMLSICDPNGIILYYEAKRNLTEK